MPEVIRTLWDLLEPVVRRPSRRRGPDANGTAPSHASSSNGTLTTRAPTRSQPARSRAGGQARTGSMAERYERLTRQMLAEHGIRVRKWRTSMTGVAWEVRYHDGTLSRLIESPRPKGPMSAAIFLHEVGHHAIGFHRYKPRCLEEYHAWAWSLGQMEAHGLNVTDAVRHRMHESLYYAIEKARRRGLRRVPPELAPFMDRPARRAAPARR